MSVESGMALYDRGFWLGFGIGVQTAVIVMTYVWCFIVTPLRVDKERRAHGCHAKDGFFWCEHFKRRDGKA